MPTPPLTDAFLMERLALVKEHGTIAGAARAIGVIRATLQSQITLARQRGLDKDIASVPVGFSVTGTSTLYDPQTGEAKAQWVKTKAEPSVEDVVETVREAFDAIPKAPPIRPAKQTDADLVTVYPLPDLHIGMYAWGAEAGEDWDLEKAEQTIKDAFLRVFESSPASHRAAVVGLGDLLHADNSENRTLKSGNVLDVDTRFSKVMHTAIRIIAYCIDLARQKHGEVLVRILPGNHDEHASVTVSYAMDQRYRADDRVKVDLDPSRFWFWRFESVLLAATHGDQLKMRDLPLFMAASRSDDWGGTKHRYAYVGHIHHREKPANEFGGVEVEAFQAPIPKDAYHAGHGYLSGRSLSSITYHRDRGEILRSKVVLTA